MIERRKLSPLLLLLLCAYAGARRARPKQPHCKIHSLDISTLFKASDGSPAASCDAGTKFAINDYNGVTYLAHNAPGGDGFLRGEHITQSQHAGPWFLNEALQKGGGIQDIENADKVFVYDHCYFMWWLAFAHTYGGNQSAWPMNEYPGGELITLYHSLLKHPRWQKNHGRDFVFFFPHPALWGGPAGPDFNHIICRSFAKATFVVVERMQRFLCGDYRTRQVIVAPYSSNSKYQTCPATAGLKTNFLFYKGRCIPPTQFPSTGIMLRHDVMTALPERPDVLAECDGDQSTPQSHSALLETMSQFRFCLVLAGDTSSSRRLADAMLAGCLPVFVGPPFHTLPFASTVDYASFAIFFNNTSARRLSKEAGETQEASGEYFWEADPSKKKPIWAGEASWFVPDAHVQQFAIPIDSYGLIVPSLESMSKDEVNDRMEMMDGFASYFRYLPEYGGRASATQLIIDGICSS